MHIPDGTFKFTKLISIVSFQILTNKSYQEGRLYSCKYPPQTSYAIFNIRTTYTILGSQKDVCPQKDLVGKEIRMKIKEIGTLWRNSPNNPQIDVEVLENWNNLIEEWITQTKICH